MTARCYPEAPRFTNEGERIVWQRLRDTLPGDAILVANQRLTDGDKDYEADIIAMLPGAGIVILEVKGGSVWYDGDDWHQSGGGKRIIHPVAQARDAKHALRHYVQTDDRWSRGGVVWAHAVVAPFSEFPDDFDAPDCPRTAIHGKSDLDDLAWRIEQTAVAMKQGKRPPTHDDIELACEILRGRGFTHQDINAEAAAARAVADRLTQEQAMLLQVIRLLPRVEIRGGAGSGKTVLALTQARELTRGRPDRAPQRVALLCYSYGLGHFFRREIESWPRKQRPAFVGTYEDFARELGVSQMGDRDQSDFWEHQLPAQMAELATELDNKYDAFIVDEAQDFADDWWTPLLRAMRSEEESGLYCYTDENQRIFARFGQPPVPLVPLMLDHNLRNTKQIHDVFGSLTPTRMTALGGEGLDVEFIPLPADLDHDEAEEQADEAINILLDAGWHPGNIALLTTGKRHSAQVRATDHLGQVGYWRSFWDDEEVFYGHVLGAKGLERAAVVLWVNNEELPERASERLYVGLSRATDQLIVIGNPEMVRAMGGPDVAAQLGIA